MDVQGMVSQSASQTQNGGPLDEVNWVRTLRIYRIMAAVNSPSFQANCPSIEADVNPDDCNDIPAAEDLGIGAGLGSLSKACSKEVPIGPPIRWERTGEAVSRRYISLSIASQSRLTLITGRRRDMARPAQPTALHSHRNGWYLVNLTFHSHPVPQSLLFRRLRSQISIIPPPCVCLGSRNGNVHVLLSTCSGCRIVSTRKGVVHADTQWRRLRKVLLPTRVLGSCLKQTHLILHNCAAQVCAELPTGKEQPSRRTWGARFISRRWRSWKSVALRDNRNARRRLSSPRVNTGVCALGRLSHHTVSNSSYQ